MGELYKCPVCKGIHASGGDCIIDTFENYSRIVEELKTRIKELEDTMKFYANKESYSCEPYRWPEDSIDRPRSKLGYFQKAEEMPVVKDFGKKAQKVLKKK